MATSPYLADYGLYKENASFKISFDIPNNCIYSKFTDTDGSHVISVQLADGAKHPSTTFTTHQEIYDCDFEGDLTVAFELPVATGGVGLAQRPKMIVNDLKG